MLTRKIQKKYNELIDQHLSRRLLKSMAPVDIRSSDTIVIFSQVSSKYNSKLYALLSIELSKRGIISFFLYKNELLSPYYPSFKINGYQINNAFTASKKRNVIPPFNNPLFFEWDIEIENERIEAQGVNFFPLIRNTLRSMQKRYNVHFLIEDAKPNYTDLVKTCDLMLKYFFLLKEYSNENKKKIRLVGYESNYIPNGIFKILCDRFSEERDIEFVDLRRGYISYYGDHHFRESYITCANLTRTKMPFSFVVSKENLEGFDTKDIDFDDLSKPVSNAIKKNVYHSPSESQKDVIEKMQISRSQGKNIFCLFAHLFYDTPVDDRSASFAGMCEWLLETIKYFSEKEDLLLIKPHPAEFMKNEPKKRPNETLASFLQGKKTAENIIMLEPHQFSINDLKPFLNCGLIWRSSVAMELTFLGVPCIVAGNPIYNAIPLYYSKSKDHYLKMIDNVSELEATQTQQHDVAKYLYLLKNKHIPVNCISYNSQLRRSYWNTKALTEYLENGDDKIKTISDNIIV